MSDVGIRLSLEAVRRYQYRIEINGTVYQDSDFDTESGARDSMREAARQAVNDLVDDLEIRDLD